MPGNSAQSMTQLKIGLEAMQKAVGGLPLGSPVSNAVMKAISDITKHMNHGGMPGGASDPAAMIQQLANMGREAKAQPGQDAALQGLMGGGGAPPPPGGAPPGAPPMPPMGG